MILSDNQISKLSVDKVYKYVYRDSNMGSNTRTLDELFPNEDSRIVFKELIETLESLQFGDGEIKTFTPRAKKLIQQHYILSGIMSIQALPNPNQMIIPFVPKSINKDRVGNPIPSYGLGSYSYDVRIDRNFKMFKQGITTGSYCGSDGVMKPLLPIIDTKSKNPTEGLMEDFLDVDYIDIPSHSFALGNTIEAINVPRDILVECMPKSSLARIGLMAHITPIEPGFKGFITVELSNLTPYPIRVHAGIGIMAFIFHQGSEPCLVSYADRNGKYQDQPQLPISSKL